MEANFEWTMRMSHRLTNFTLQEEHKALFHHSKAERFTIAFFLSQSLVFFFVSNSNSAEHWLWLSLSITLLYSLFLFRSLASFHRIHDRLDLLLQFQHTRVLTRGFGTRSTNFMRVGLIHSQIPTPSDLRFKMVKRRLKTGGFVVLVAVFAVVMILACRWLTPPPVADMCVNCLSTDEGMTCCSLSRHISE